MPGQTTRALLAAALAAALSAATLSAAAADQRPRQPRTERVSTASDGAQLDRESLRAALSDDGRYVAFSTKASVLRGCERQTYVCLAVKDRITGRLSWIENGGGFDWGPPVLSGDGRRVGYTEGTKGPSAWVHDLDTGESTRVESSAQIQALTPDGRYVLYTSGDDRFVTDRYVSVRDLTTGTTERVEGDATHTRFGAASLSADGRYVAYVKRGAGPEGDPAFAVYVKDRVTGETVRADGGLGAADRHFVQISGDGRRVLFVAEGRTYQYDLRRGTARKVADTPARSASRNARYAALAEGGPGGEHVVLLDVRTGRRTALAPGETRAGTVSVTARGREVVFTSSAPDLVPDDTNGTSDVFVRRVR
ncbi:hypothetical protein RB200_26135 [Streptomyces sp. PmtG]